MYDRSVAQILNGTMRAPIKCEIDASRMAAWILDKLKVATTNIHTA